MKLLSCVIQGFGKFRSVRIDFPTDLTCICEENGYGKTTLAAFLKAMFYGMEQTKKSSKFSDRTHYLPFDGGQYGGMVFFEYNGIKYRVKRTFGSGGAGSKDTYELSADRGNAPYYEDPLGEKIFGIDKASFERTIFITPQETDLSSTDSIRTKLNNFVEGTTDDSNLQQAVAKLEKKAKDYRKKGGPIDTEKARSDKLRKDIVNRDKIADSLQGKYDALAAYDRDIEDLRIQVSKAQDENTLRADWDHYDELTGAVYDARDSINAIKDRYPYGVPAVEEVASARKALAGCETDLAVLQKKTFTAEDEALLADYARKFANGIPNDESLDRVAADVHRVQELDAGIAADSAKTPTESQAALKRRFDGRLPDESDLQALEGYEKQYREEDEAYSAVPDMQPSKPAGRKLNVMLLIIAAVLLVAGIGVCFAQLIAGIVLIVIGVVVALIDGFLYLNKASNAHSAGALNTQKLAHKDKRDEAGNRIGAIIMPYGYSFEGGVLFGSSSFKKDLASYREYLAEENERLADLHAKQQERAAKADALRMYFRRFGIEGDQLADSHARLREQINTYNTLRERKNASKKGEEVTYASYQAHMKAVMDFCGKYGLPADSLESMKQAIDEADTDSRNCSGYVDAYNEAARKANEFMARKKLAPRPEGRSVDIDSINAVIQTKLKERGQIALETDNAEREVEARQGFENDLEDSREKLAKYTASVDIILKTKEALKAADDRLKDKYANPISGSFDKYEKLLQKTTGEKIYMTRDLTVRFEHAGEERGEEYLSSGQRAACALCYRLAILDNMYSGEKPFLILDDPFCYMDASHFASSKALLENLSGSFQIIYLTCHESRMI